MEARRIVRVAGSAVARANLHGRIGLEPDRFAAHYRNALKGIEGWRFRQDLAVLYALARDVPGEGCAFEIGSFKGLATAALALGVSDGGKQAPVYTVDPHTGDKQDLERSGVAVKPSEAAFRQNLTRVGVDDLVDAYVMTSDELSEVWQHGRIRVLFIDGWHGYEAVASDIRNWVPLLTDHGVVVIDDYLNYEEVRRAVDDSDLLASMSKHRAGRMWLGERAGIPPSVRKMLRVPWG